MGAITHTRGYLLSFALLFLHSAALTWAGTLPDTGQTNCLSPIDSDNTAPAEDCRYGRDAAAASGMLSKVGGGIYGFDYTKIANNGTPLPADAVLGTADNGWACVTDNVTGLTWEVKTSITTDLRYFGHSYTWFSSDYSENGGNSGSNGSNSSACTLVPPAFSCDTEAYATSVNRMSLCSFSDWRLPSYRELMTLVVFGSATNPLIDANYFPNSPAVPFWASNSRAQNPLEAWA